MGLSQHIKAAQRRKAIRFAIETEQRRVALVKVIKQSSDGGLLVHVAIEAAK